MITYCIGPKLNKKTKKNINMNNVEMIIVFSLKKQMYEVVFKISCYSGCKI